MQKIKLREIFWYFFILGLLTIGGGYVMISLMEKELCEKRGWITKDEFLEIIAVAQSLPGILATNTATFVGQNLRGTMGAIVATIGVALPSFIVIWSLYPFLTKSFQNPTIDKIYLGAQCGVIILILNSAISLLKNSVKNKFSIFIFIVSLIVLISFKINPTFIVIFGFLSGYILFLYERKC